MNIKEESDAKVEPRIVKLDVAAAPVAQQYQFGRIHRPGEGSYSTVKAKFGALAATDPERANRSQKNRRFALNQLLRDPLSVEEEERRVIEERVRARVSAMAEDAKTKGAEEGYKDGLKKGHEEAYKRFQEEAAERMKHFEALIAEAEGTKAEIFKANEHYLMDLVYRMGRMVALKEIQSDKEYVLRLIRELIERLGVREGIKLRVNPNDVETIGMLKQGLESTFGTMKNLSIEPSPQVRRGGCMLETEWNAIDASLDTQFDGLYEAMVGNPKAQSSEEKGP